MRYRRLRVKGGTYFFTLVTHERAPILAEPGVARLFYEALGQVRADHAFVLDAHVVMPDHVHLMLTLPENDDDFSTRLMLVKAGFTRRYLAGGRSAGQRRENRRERAVWQGRFWEHLVASDTEFDECADYIHYNPVRHGLVASPSDWPHSSLAQWIADERRDASWNVDRRPRRLRLGGEP